MFRSDYKHFEKEFRTKHKVFYFSLVDRGSVIKISEWRKKVSFSMKLDLGGADWIRKVVSSTLRQNSAADFKRFYRNHNYRLILESCTNSAGRFMKICKIQNGTLNYLFIPEEINGQGWKNFGCCLDSFFGTKQVQKIDRMGSTQDEMTSKGEGWRLPSANSAVQKEGESKSHNRVWLGSDQQNREWRTAVVVYRNTVYLSWAEIRKRTEVKLRRVVEVASLAADRAIIWCQNEEETSTLLSNPLQFSNGKNQIRMERWNPFVHWDNLQIQVNHSWIGIEGLPINMWNIHVFKIIGKSLGGLLEVAPETRTLNFLKYAMIKVGGLEGGLMDPILEILCQGLRVSLGIFSISNPRNFAEGGRTLGLLTRAVVAENEAEGHGQGGVENNHRSRHVNSFELKKPRFILGRTVFADVAVRNGKANPAKTYKGALLSAGSDMGKGKKGVALTYDRFFYSTNGEDDDWNSKVKKGGQTEAFSISEGVSQNPGMGAILDGQKQKIGVCRSFSDCATLNSPSHVGPGLGNLNQSQSEFRKSGQASFNLDKYQDRDGLDKAQMNSGRWASGQQSNQAHNQVKMKSLLENKNHGPGLRFKSKLNGSDVNSTLKGPGSNNQLKWKMKQRTQLNEIIPRHDSALTDFYHIKRDDRRTFLRKQHKTKADDGYYSEVEVRANRRNVRRAASIPIEQKEIKNSCPKVLQRVNPKLKGSFCSGKIINWNDFAEQEIRKKQENSNLSAHDPCDKMESVSNKPSILNVYSRNHVRKNRGGKEVKQNLKSVQKDADTLKGFSEGSEGRKEIKGFSSSYDDTSSEEFNITTDNDAELEKEKQEEASFEGVRCLLGDGRQEWEGAIGIEEDQVLNQANYSGAAVYQTCGEDGNFLNALNIKLIKAEKRNQSDKRDEGPSFTKRSGVRELRNLVCNVNYEHGLRGKGKISYQ